MSTIKKGAVEAQMLIRQPVAKVFEAFIDPEITRHFWFTRSSGRLEAGKKIVWEWEMYDVSTSVLVKEVIPGERISIDWGEPATAVDFFFRQAGTAATYVTIVNSGFHSSGEALLTDINDNAGGFTTVLDGLKAYMEHGINLNLIADKFLKDPAS